MNSLPPAFRLGLGAGFAVACLAGSAAAQEAIPLRPKSLRDWDLLLPAPQAREVGSGFAVGGVQFAAEAEGEILRADLDADGVMEAIVEGESGFLVLRGEAAEGREVRYSVRLTHPENRPWSWTTGGGLAATIAGEPVLFLDQNLDGDVGDVGVDAMVIGRDHAASFLSRVASIGGALYALEIAADELSVRVAPWDGPAGTLDLAANFSSKARLDAAVVVSADATLSFSLARAGGGLKLPAGEYRLHSGRLALGDSSATIGAGSARAILVGAGERVAPEWGGPVRAEFAVERGRGQLAFSPWDIWFYGRLGEEYANFLPLGESPQFTVRERATGEPLVYARFPGNC
jgi:hypothetical protein